MDMEAFEESGMLEENDTVSHLHNDFIVFIVIFMNDVLKEESCNYAPFRRRGGTGYIVLLISVRWLVGR